MLDGSLFNSESHFPPSFCCSKYTGEVYPVCVCVCVCRCIVRTHEDVCVCMDVCERECVCLKGNMS